MDEERNACGFGILWHAAAHINQLFMINCMPLHICRTPQSASVHLALKTFIPPAPDASILSAALLLYHL